MNRRKQDVVVHDGLSAVTYGADSRYDPAFLSLKDAERLFTQLCAELYTDKQTGIVDPSREMLIVDGLAKPDKTHTALHVRQSRYTNVFGQHPMPHRHTYFGSAGVDEPRKKTVNRTLVNIPALQPKADWTACPAVDEIRGRLESYLGLPTGFLNFANLNLYMADSKSKLGQHQDQDHGAAMGEYIVHTVSLGAPRKYIVLQKTESPKSIGINLQPGSVNMLGHKTNNLCTHGMKPSIKAGVRISINYRHIPCLKCRDTEAASLDSNGEERTNKRQRVQCPPASSSRPVSS